VQKSVSITIVKWAHKSYGNAATSVNWKLNKN